MNIFDSVSDIDKIYQDTKIDDKNKLESISNLIIKSNIKEFMKDLKKETRESYKLKFEKELSTKINDILNEKNKVSKAFKLTEYLHITMYDLLTKQADLKLNGSEEMKVESANGKTYYTIVCKTTDSNIIFHAFALLLGLECVANSHSYLALDFEYMTSFVENEFVIKNKLMKLGQLCFEHQSDPRQLIFIINPLSFNKNEMHDFVYYTLCSKKIKKILHGSDSLDIPNIYGNFFKNAPELIIKFTRSLMDTKLFCEYYKASILGIKEASRCGMYETLLFFEIIDDEKMKDFDKIDKGMPIHEDRTWYVDKLGENQLKYALYDVLFLKDLFYQIIKFAHLNTPLEQQKSTLIVFANLIPEMIQLIYLERNQISNIIKECELETSVINNYMIKNTAKGVLRILDIFKNIFKDIKIKTPFYFDVDRLMLVNYFNKPFSWFFKQISFTIIHNKYTIYVNKTDVWKGTISTKNLYEFMDKNKYKHILQFLKAFQELIYYRIVDYVSKS
jgi:hypothetical protein